MKKGFTLVELLVVVVVIVVLMSMTFRLSSIGDDSNRRNETVSRMNRIENCLSGYYAAFGSYPPVPLHGSRNIYAKVDGHGIQSESEENEGIWGWNKIGDQNEGEAWRQVQAACKAQPVACRFPFPGEPVFNDLVKTVMKSIQKKANNTPWLSKERKQILNGSIDNGVTDNMGRFNANRGESDWRRIQLFKFGLMSYLLPRYLVMMHTDKQFFPDNADSGYAQWNQNNQLPLNPMTGDAMTWQYIQECAEEVLVEAKDRNKYKLAQVANIPSQAVTARWMPNLAEIVCCNHDFELYGIKIRGDVGASDLRGDNLYIEVFSPGGYGGSGSAYVLDSITMMDGWWNEFYYYSPPPYQSYTLWSGGANDRTFPPWISRQQLDASKNRLVSLWTEDDIVRMSN